MRERVEACLATYAEGGSIDGARKMHGLSGTDFYGALRQYPELRAKYHDIQADRADMMIDEAYQHGSNPELHPGTARVMVETRVKIAALYDRRRFGERVDINVTQVPDIAGALADARARLALRHARDPLDISDAQVVEPAALPHRSAGDALSADPAAPGKAAGSDPDIFADD